MPKTLQPKEFVLTQDELAEQLGISRRTVARMMQLPDHPERTDDGKYDVSRWREFREEYSEEISSAQSFPKEIKEELGKLRIRRDRAIAEREEIILMKLKKELVPASAVRAVWTEFREAQSRLIREAFLAIKSISYAEAEQRFNDLEQAICDQAQRIGKNHEDEDEEG